MTLNIKITKKMFEKALNETKTLSGACLKCGLTDTNGRYILNKVGWEISTQHLITPIKNTPKKRTKKRKEIDIDALKIAFQKNTPIKKILNDLEFSNFSQLKAALKNRGFQIQKTYKVN